MSGLSSTDFHALKAALLDAFDTKPRIAELVLTAHNVSLDRVALGEDTEEIMAKVIRRADSEFWLAQLQSAAMSLQPHNERLVNLRVEWQSLVGVRRGDPYKALTLPGKMVLLDRVKLRKHLAELEEPDGPRVLVVDGAEKSGQTYSVHYISYICAVRQTFRCVYIDLQRLPKNDSDQVDAFTLGSGVSMALLGETYPPPNDKNLATWIDPFCAWLARSLDGQQQQRGQGVQWWVVIDHFRKVGSDTTSLDLVAALAMRTYRDLNSMRLILLNYRDHEWLKARVIGSVEREAIPAIDEKTELARFFSQLHRDEALRRGELTPSTAALVPRITASVRNVLTAPPCEGACPMERMGRATWEEVQRVVRLPDAEDPVEDLYKAAVAELEGDPNTGGGHAGP